jgi:hypothetical protein
LYASEKIYPKSYAENLSETVFFSETGIFENRFLVTVELSAISLVLKLSRSGPSAATKKTTS